MACIVARQGRQMQRYNSGRRLVVGCIPYRLIKTTNNSDHGDVVEVLVITSRKGHGMMFPKGGWESDETVTEAASREAVEEAGVRGEVEDILGKWKYKSRRYGTFYEGFMFPLRVGEELPHWPEMGATEVGHRRGGEGGVRASVDDGSSRGIAQTAIGQY